MRIEFDKIILHNFLSYGHSEIDLCNKGYCLVSGVNHCKKDNALSNGSGKSSWISAICWALTGETIQGITKDIKNIYIDEDSCYVKLDFKVDNSTYSITRYNKPKSDLKVFVNGEDKSGKGIRESEIVLSNYLPDITKNLITSVILLGQGLPNKLSSHSPSGRKEMLEQLSKSDFMIEDIKKRINTRQDELNKSKRELDDNGIKLNTEYSMNSQSLKELESQRDSWNGIDYDSSISKSTKRLDEINDKLQSLSKSQDDNQRENDSLSNQLLNLTTNKQSTLNDELTCYYEKRDSLVNEKSTLKCKVDVLKKEIDDINNIKDVCPTCGRPFEGVVKPSTKEQEKQLELLASSMKDIDDRLEECLTKHKSYIVDINNDFDVEINDIKEKISINGSTLLGIKGEYDNLIEEKSELIKEVERLKSEKSTYESRWKELLDKLDSIKNACDSLTKDIKSNNDKIVELQGHIDVVKKMDTLVKRDFRGYLLSNVISFIDSKSKEYCNDVFGSSDIEFYLDGNNIEISYCNKPFECLSGGEKQKVDIVLQFAIRDMMSKYLDFSSNILCLDEIFDNLDSISTNSVLNLIANRLNDVESLFIISHHSDELSIPSDCELIIEKNEQGISEVR